MERQEQDCHLEEMLASWQLGCLFLLHKKDNRWLRFVSGYYQIKPRNAPTTVAVYLVGCCSETPLLLHPRDGGQGANLWGHWSPCLPLNSYIFIIITTFSFLRCLLLTAVNAAHSGQWGAKDEDTGGRWWLAMLGIKRLLREHEDKG